LNIKCLRNPVYCDYLKRFDYSDYDSNTIEAKDASAVSKHSNKNNGNDREVEGEAGGETGGEAEGETGGGEGNRE